MIIAVDTGGTKTLIAAFERDGTTHVLEKFPTPRDTTDYIVAVRDAIIKHQPVETIDAIVVALPGPIDNNVLRRAKNLGWQTVDIITMLRDSFPDTLIELGNDADLAGLGEARRLEHEPGLCLYVTLSTGIGTGLSYGGKLLPHLGQFEGGWMHLAHEGTLQEWENFASGNNFYQRYGQYGSDVNDPEKWRDYAARVATGLRVLIPLLQPDTLVVGGSMGTHFAKYEAFLRDELQVSIPAFMNRTTILQAKHPEEAVIYGCYYHAVDQLALAEA